MPAYGLLYTSARDYCCAPLTDYFKDLEVGTIDEGEVYSIQYTNDPKQFDLDLPIIQKMISSFQITPHQHKFTYHGGYLDGFSDARRGFDEAYNSGEPYALGYRDGHRDALKQVEVHNGSNSSQASKR